VVFPTILIGEGTESVVDDNANKGRFEIPEAAFADTCAVYGYHFRAIICGLRKKVKT